MAAKTPRPTVCFFLLLVSLATVLAPKQSRAQIGSDRYSSIVVQADTGTVLSAVNPDEPRYPASLTKLMTLYMVFEALRDRRIGLDQPVAVSAYAASMQPSKLGLLPGTDFTVGQAILGLVTKSANDAAAALGELLGGDEVRFAEMMTLRARALGMTSTKFENASGLPDPEQRTTARDMAILARRILIDFPAYYGYFSTPSFVFHGRVIVNHDRMLQAYPGADGLKTGYTEASGFNLVTSAVHSGVRLIGVVLGAGSSLERDLHMASLLDAGFEQLDVPAEHPIEVAQLFARAPRLIATAATSPTLPLRHGRFVERFRTHRVQLGMPASAGGFANRKPARAGWAPARRASAEAELRVLPAKLPGRAGWRAHVSRISDYQLRAGCAGLQRAQGSCPRPQRG